MNELYHLQISKRQIILKTFLNSLCILWKEKKLRGKFIKNQNNQTLEISPKVT